jgi:hypothetical protein
MSPMPPICPRCGAPTAGPPHRACVLPAAWGYIIAAGLASWGVIWAVAFIWISFIR